MGDMRPLLHIYLDDHFAGAAAGVALAGRIARENAGTGWHATLLSIARDIESDERTLAELRSRLDAQGGRAKRVFARVGEWMARVKPNGRILGYSPLSRLLEVEALIAGVAGKHRLWAALEQSGSTAAAMPELDLGAMLTRAEHQLDLLGTFHRQAAEVALGGRSATDMHPDAVR